MADRVSLHVGGRRFEGWRSASVVRSIEGAAGSFHLEVTEKHPGRPAAREIRDGDEVVITIGGDPVLTGYVDVLDIATVEDGVRVRIEGRDKTGDLVDCSPDPRPSEWKGVTLQRLAEILAEPFGIKVLSDVAPGDPFPKVALSPGETVWNLLEERARYRGLLAMSDGQGGLLITEAGKAGRGEPLVHGGNILASSLTRSSSDRFSVYIVKGQSGGTDFSFGIPAASPEARAIDKAVRRHRPLVVVASSSVDAGRCSKRARYEATVRAGRAEAVRIDVQGWHQRQGGPLWVPNLIVAVDSDPLGVHADLVVSQVALLQKEDSTTTTLDLVRPDAFAPLPEPEVEDSGLGFDVDLDDE